MAAKMMMKVHEPPKAATLSASRCPSGQLLFKFLIGIAADMPAFAEMLNHPTFPFRKFIDADLKPLLYKIWKLIVHKSDPPVSLKDATLYQRPD